MKSLEEMIASAQQAAERIRAAQAQLEEALDGMEVAGGSGPVQVRATAAGRIVGFTIDPSLLAPGHHDALSAHLAEACNAALAQAARVADAERERLGIPSLPL